MVGSMRWLALAGVAAAGLAWAMVAPAAADDRMKVVTTFTVLADMARNVAGDAADVVSITKPGAEIHGYQPTPRDIVGAVGRRPHPVERPQSGALVRAVPHQSGRRPLGDPDGRDRADRHRGGLLRGASQPACLDGARERARLRRQHPRRLRDARPGQCRGLRGQCGGLQGHASATDHRAAAGAIAAIPETSAGSSPARGRSATSPAISA